MSAARLQNRLYTVAQVRELDRLAIKHGVAGFELMMRAAIAAFDRLKQQWPDAEKILVICGGGNNGGDGYLLAALALQASLEVTVVDACSSTDLKNDALLAYQHWQQCGGQGIALTQLENNMFDVDVIVDALLGTGLQRPVSGEWVQLIERINAAQCPVLAIDIASGLNADTGQIMGAAVTADITVSFIGLKRGMVTADGTEVSGKIFLDDLNVRDSIYQQVSNSACVIDDKERQQLLAPRKAGSHKGDFGHVLLVGGNNGMPGAIQMAAMAAARSGAGLVSIATRGAHAVQIATASPGLMAHAVENGGDLQPLLKRADVVVVGPGLGQGAWANDLLDAVLESELPLVVDADGLNLLARKQVKYSNWVLTPHPAEAARLLQCETSDIQSDRFTAVTEIASQYGGAVVLKGNGSLIAENGNEAIYCCRQGNPGMASAGMGDVLTGVIAALLAQGLSLSEAARIGVYIHANAADSASADGQRGTCATDLLPAIRHWVNP